MRTITCPRCGSPITLRRAFSAENKPFCARCGWNLERAEIATAGKGSAAKLVPLAIAVLGLIAAVAARKANSPVMFLIPLAFGAVVFLPWWGSTSARKAVAAAKLSANPSWAMAQPFVDPALQQLQSLPRPRRVRFRFPSSLVIILAVTLLLGFGGLYIATSATANTRAHSNPSGILVVPIVFAVLFVIPFFRDKRNLPLMRDGALALGRVTYQQNIVQGKSSYSRIGYEFKTSSGQLIQDQAKDLTYSVFEDMTIPVFYDPLNPAKNITPCATYRKSPQTRSSSFSLRSVLLAPLPRFKLRSP